MIPKNKVPADIQKMLKTAPVFTEDDVGVKPVGTGVRGFAAHMEHINRNGRPRVADPRISVSVRLPKSYVEKMRGTGRGWQTRLSESILKNIPAAA